MKLFRLFAATLVAVLLFAPSANATVLKLNDGNPMSAGFDKTYLGRFMYQNIVNYDISGVLAAKTQLTLTLKATNLSPANLVSWIRSSGTDVRAKWTYANNTQLVSTITISNLSTATKNISAYFYGLLSSCNCEARFTIRAAVSAVPLPPSALLFGAALMGIAGFAARKKALGQI